MSDEGVPQLVVVARALDAEALEAEVLLLAALGVPYELVPDGDDLALAVPAAHADRARVELASLDPAAPTAPPAPRLRHGIRAAFPTAVALLAFHTALALLPEVRRLALYDAGELDARRVRAGEVWRLATALTLHADPGHVVGNAIATLIFVGAAGDWVGPGVALLCTLVAGILGNGLAVAFDPAHHAIGFSTATFGALGLTAVFGFVARYRDAIERKRAWLALGGGIALLALLGAGERSDLLAHLFGLGSGALVGLFVTRSGGTFSRRAPRDTGPVGQVLAALAAVTVTAGAWLLGYPR